jgi:hypothetical protein
MAATQTDPEKGVESFVPGLVVRPEPAHYIYILKNQSAVYFFFTF